MELKFHRLEFFQRLTSSVSLLLGGVDTSIAWFQSSLLPLPTPLFSVELPPLLGDIKAFSVSSDSREYSCKLPFLSCLLMIFVVLIEEQFVKAKNDEIILIFIRKMSK